MRSGAGRPDSSTSRHLTAVGREVLLTVVAVVGAVFLVAGVASVAFGISTYVVRSGSMAPSIDAGDVVVTREVPAADLRVDDVVTVRAADGSRVTHRIAEVTPTSGSVTVDLTLKGDANAQADDTLYRVGSTDRVITHVPKVGYVVIWLQTPIGLGVVGFVVVSSLASLLIPRRREVLAVGAVAALIAGPAAAAGTPPSTAAYFTDSPRLQTGSIATGTVPQVGPLSCSIGLLGLASTVTWTADPLYDYTVVLKQVGGAVISTKEVTGTANSITYSGLLDFGILNLGTYDYTVEVRTKLAQAPSWVAATTRTYSTIRVAYLLVGATATCTT